MQYFILTFLVFFISSCSNTKNYITYDNTNPVKIEEATRGLSVNEIVPSNLDGAVAVRSIELDLSNQLDVGVVYMIEDHLIDNLIDNGNRVLERDPDALSNIYRESTSNYKKENPQFNIDSNSQNSETDTSDGVNVINVNLASDNMSDNNNSNINQDTENELLDTELNAADYILSYRVLECGVIYTALDENTKSANNLQKVKRSARSRLHCRLTNTKTSEIISAGIVENEVTDVVNMADVLDLEQISYQYYHHTLPNQAAITQPLGLTEDSGYATVNESRPVEKSSAKVEKAGMRWPVIMGGMFAVLFLITQLDDDDDNNY